MAERPILKNEREAQQANPEQSSSEQAPKRNVPRPVKKGDRKDSGEGGGEQKDPTQGHWTDDMDSRGKGGRKGGKGKGRGKGRGGDARKGPMNPALMRGPRPTAKVEEPETEEVVTEETAADVAADASVETGAEASADTVTASADAATSEGVPTTDDSAAEAAPAEAAANESADA